MASQFKQIADMTKFLLGFGDDPRVTPPPEIPDEVVGTRDIPQHAAQAHSDANYPLIDKKDYINFANEVSAKYGQDPTFIQAVMEQESRYRPQAVSKKGAAGLMQIMPATWKKDLGMDPADIHDPRKNIEGGVKYYKLLDGYMKEQERKRGITIPRDTEHYLAAYNWGIGHLGEAIQKHGSSWLLHAPKETKDYIRKVKKKQERIKKGNIGRLNAKK